MNYIFGNNTLYPRSGGRVGGSSQSQGTGPGVKQKLGPKRCSSEELGPPPHTSSPSTSSPASSVPSTSSSRWQQLLMFFSRRSAFTDCMTASQVTTLTTVYRKVYVKGGESLTFLIHKEMALLLMQKTTKMVQWEGLKSCTDAFQSIHKNSCLNILLEQKALFETE